MDRQRRAFLKQAGAVGTVAIAGGASALKAAAAALVLYPAVARSDERSDALAAKLKEGYRQRLKKLLSAKRLPYIDIESSCNPTELNIDALAAELDRLDIGLMAMSADITGQQFERGVRSDDLSERLSAKYPDRFIPVGNGGVPPAWTRDTDQFLAAYERKARDGAYLLLGEFEFRHYASPRQVQRGQFGRDITVPIDGPIGHRVFSLSAQLGLPVQLHYEIEDSLLPPLEAMLEQYPRAQVIWCHVAQVRYAERASAYNASYAEGLIKRFANLYFDTAFGDARSVYPLSGQRHARVWADNGSIRSDWLNLFVTYPQRFLAALDLGGDRMHRIREWDTNLRSFLKALPEETAHHIGYKSAWKLLFNEEFA